MQPPDGPVFSVGSGHVRSWIDRLLGLQRLEAIYRSAPPTLESREFVAWAVQALGIRVACDAREGSRIPERGALIVVANHPFGGCEGLALLDLILRSRPDVKLLANDLLGRLPQLRDLLIGVDVFAGRGGARRNAAALRAAAAWLAQGGVLATFPAGEVARFDRRSCSVTDGLWSPSIGALARRTGCAVLPVHFCGRNGVVFHLLSSIWRPLGTLWLGRALLARKDRPLLTRIGSLIPSAQLTGLADLESTAYLRSRTEVLGLRPGGIPTNRPTQPRRTPRAPIPIAPPVPQAHLEAEVRALGAERVLLRSGEFEVISARAEEIPELLRQIGRERERAFRVAGEGTGRAIDLDRFDNWYHHIFLWNRAQRELIGAYRLGRTTEILPSRGIEGLYTSTLFRFDDALFSQLGPAIELGRSFVRPEDQRSYSALLLLWRGIGRFVLQQPACSTLFGPVSVSADYTSISQRLLVAFLDQNRFTHDASRWVRPRTPFRRGRATPALARLRTLEDVSGYISEIEADGKGVPILLRQYLKLGGRLLGFNVDPEFSSVLDVLVLVDLRATPSSMLARYMGADDARNFIEASHEAGIRAS